MGSKELDELEEKINKQVNKEMIIAVPLVLFIIISVSVISTLFMESWRIYDETKIIEKENIAQSQINSIQRFLVKIEQSKGK